MVGVNEKGGETGGGKKPILTRSGTPTITEDGEVVSDSEIRHSLANGQKSLTHIHPNINNGLNIRLWKRKSMYLNDRQKPQ